MSPSEMEATRADAKARLHELRAVREILWPDRDDSEVLSEIVVVESQIRSCEEALADEPSQARRATRPAA
jgi:hypothetical protein